MTVTQASLSTDLPSPIGARAADGTHPAANSEAALWLFGLTSATLVVASLMLLGLLASSSAADDLIGGFVSATAVVIAAIGLGALTYVVVAAKRAGYLKHTTTHPVAAPEAPAGLHVVPAVPADLAHRKRRQRAQEQSARNKQARAIASAEAVKRRPMRAVAPVAIARRTTPAPVHVQVRPPARAPMRVRIQPPAQARPPVAAAHRQPVPLRRPLVQTVRPTPTLTFPRMPAPFVRPRTQVALAQVAAAEIRARAMRPAARPALARRAPVHA